MARLSDRVRALMQPHLAGIAPYDPAFAPTAINLSANESTYPLPEGVRSRIDAALAATPLNRYPDPAADALRDELAAWHGVGRDSICAGNGGDELLYNFLLAFGGTTRRVVVCPPDFSEYAFFASLTRTAIRRIPRDAQTLALDGEALAEAACDADLVVIASPNNPTGDTAPLDLIERVCAQCPGLVMVDEAYGEFADEGSSAESLLSRCDNLVVLHTLSKAFGAAGIRCGYVLAAPDVIEAFLAVRQIYSVNVLTQAAALELVRARDEFAPIIETVRSERARLAQGLRALAGPLGDRACVWEGQGNFVLVRLPQAASVRARLRDDYSILVRDFSLAPGLSDCLRITVGMPAENDAVLAALAEILQNA